MTVNNQSNSCQTSFLDAVRHQGPVQGNTHNLYKYPARFSPVFARAAIETFTKPGDVVLDPFVGGGTSMVEARLLGRHGFSSDISSLAVFLTRTKSIPLPNSDLSTIESWFEHASGDLNIHQPTVNLREGDYEGYDKNMPWRLRKLCEQYLASIDELPALRLRRFARCVLLRCGQWAMDCRKTIPTVEEFRIRLAEILFESTMAMREFSSSLSKNRKSGIGCGTFRCVQSSAKELNAKSFGSSLQKKANLILTSPPYPGVYVLYHRWKVRGRKETPAPFWLADCRDGEGQSHYCFGDRRSEGLHDYFDGIRESFAGVREIVDPNALVVQVVSFKEPRWQISNYLEAMKQAGFAEVMPKKLGIPVSGRLWREVPGRRWFAMIQGELSTSKELVLFHRPA